MEDNKALMAYDDETKKYIEVSRDAHDISNRFMKMIEFADILKAVGIAAMCSKNKYYLVQGYTSIEDFYVRGLNMSKMQGLKYKKLGDYVINTLGIDIDDSVKLLPNGKQKVNSSLPFNENQKQDLQNLSDLYGNLGINRLYDFLRIDIDLRQVAMEDEVTFPDGTKMTLAQILSQKSDKLSKQVSDLQRQLMREKESRKKTEEENKYKDKLIDEKENKIQNANEIERMYGAKASTVESQRMVMDKARKHLGWFEQYLYQMNIQDDSPPALKKDLADLIKRLGASHSRAVNNHLFLMDQIEEYD